MNQNNNTNYYNLNSVNDLTTNVSSTNISNSNYTQSTPNITSISKQQVHDLFTSLCSTNINYIFGSPQDEDLIFLKGSDNFYKNEDDYIVHLLRHYDSDVVKILHELSTQSVPEKLLDNAIIKNSYKNYSDIYNTLYGQNMWQHNNSLPHQTVPSHIHSFYVDSSEDKRLDYKTVIGLLEKFNLIKTKEEVQTHVLLFKSSDYLSIREYHDVDFCIKFINEYPYESNVIKTRYDVKHDEEFKKTVNKIKLKNEFVSLEYEE